MDGILNSSTVVCCFCGESLNIKDAMLLTVKSSVLSEEKQDLFAHKQHFVEVINKAVPLHPDFFEDDEDV